MLQAEKNDCFLAEPRPAVSHASLLLDFAGRQRSRSYRPRQVVLRQFDRTDHVLVILSGWAEQARELSDGRRQILSIALRGDLCTNDLSAGAVMDQSITAITPLSIAIIGKREFCGVLGAHARLAQSCWRNQMLTLSIQRRWIAMIGRMGAMERIAHLLCEAFVRQERMGLTLANACAFPLTQLQIAEACGLTQVHTNRIIQELRKRGLIDLRRRRLRISSMEELSALAQFDPAYLNLASPESHEAPFLRKQTDTPGADLADRRGIISFPKKDNNEGSSPKEESASSGVKNVSI